MKQKSHIILVLSAICISVLGASWIDFVEKKPNSNDRLIEKKLPFGIYSGKFLNPLAKHIHERKHNVPFVSALFSIYLNSDSTYFKGSCNRMIYRFGKWRIEGDSIKLYSSYSLIKSKQIPDESYYVDFKKKHIYATFFFTPDLSKPSISIAELNGKFWDGQMENVDSVRMIMKQIIEFDIEPKP